MNAVGISVFYGATSVTAALSEVRPPVGSRVAVAKFDIVSPLRLLDLTALEDVKDSGSIFDPTLKRRLERVAFLRSLSQRITRSVMPDDQAFDYLATQAVADFLATENDPRLDGIVFRSAQAKDGRNVVLFQKAARCAELDLPDSTEIDASTGHHTEEGWEVNYWVIETVPSTPTPPADPADQRGQPDIVDVFGTWFIDDDDTRAAVLHIDPTSVHVHHVEWVSYDTTAHVAYRHRFEMGTRKY